MFAMKTFGLLSLFVIYASGQDAVVTDGPATPPTTTPTPTPTEPAPTPTPTEPAPKNGSTTPATPILTTTVKPSGDDAPVGTYHFTEGGKTCLLVQMALKMNFTFNQTYPEGNQTKYRMVDVMWNLPKQNETRVSNMSSCKVNNDSNNQRLVLQFFQDYAYYWNLTLHFSKDKDNKVKVSNITLEYKEDSLRFTNLTMPTGSDISTTAHSDDFTWSEAGFKCSSTEDVTGFPLGNMTRLNAIKTADVKIEAFRTGSDTTFSKDITYCAADTTVSNIVPIAVGAALAGLVLIVLVAYLIGRSRNKRGYESV